MMKGALVELLPASSISVPNVVVFQFNPEKLSHGWSQHLPASTADGQAGGHPLAVAGEPTETFSFTLSLDVTDQFADLDQSVRDDAAANGIYTRLAALELLMYPSAINDLAASLVGQSWQTPAAQLPMVLFVWGTFRVLPVRVTSLSVSEELYDENLNPTHAEVQLELRVLTPTELSALSGLPGQVANAAYAYSQGIRLARAASAAASLGDSARAVIGILRDTSHVLP